MGWNFTGKEEELKKLHNTCDEILATKMISVQ